MTSWNFTSNAQFSTSSSLRVCFDPSTCPAMTFVGVGGCWDWQRSSMTHGWQWLSRVSRVQIFMLCNDDRDGRSATHGTVAGIPIRLSSPQDCSIPGTERLTLHRWFVACCWLSRTIIHGALIKLCEIAILSLQVFVMFGTFICTIRT